MVKYGKIGAPKSAKRKKFLKRVRATQKGIAVKRKTKKKTGKRGIVLKRTAGNKRR